MLKNKPNFRRDRIKRENLLQYLDIILISDRNKDIVRRYTAGESETRLAECYGVTPNRIASIVAGFLWHCSQMQKQRFR